MNEPIKRSGLNHTLSLKIWSELYDELAANFEVVRQKKLDMKFPDFIREILVDSCNGATESQILTETINALIYEASVFPQKDSTYYQQFAEKTYKGLKK